MSEYSHHFIRQGMSVVDHARGYVTGLMGTQRRKNIETIVDDVPGTNYQNMEQFIGKSPWDHEALMEQVAREVNGLLGAGPNTALYIDETCFSKKGKASVGVQPQYNGRLRHKDNCQVAVFACLGHGERVGLVDMALYLPQSWTGDPARMAKAGVPEEFREPKTKLELALQLVDRSLDRGLEFGYIAMDSAYGKSHELTGALDDRGLGYVADATVQTKVWTLPPDQEGARRLSVKELCDEQFALRSQKMVLRQGTKGPVKVQAMVCRVWLKSDDFPTVRERWYIASQDADGEIRHALSNCLDINDPCRLVYMLHQRYFIEYAFREAKDQLGMAQYQVRQWRGWHHHMALVCLAMLFALREQLIHNQTIPLLSTRDLIEILDCHLPRNRHTHEGVFTNIASRHLRRQSTIERFHRRKPPS